jgi:hypothetical protein
MSESLLSSSQHPIEDASALLRSLGVKIRQYGLNLRAVAIRTTRMRFLVLSQMLTALEHFAALAAAILIDGHRRFLQRVSVASEVQKHQFNADERSSGW